MTSRGEDELFGQPSLFGISDVRYIRRLGRNFPKLYRFVSGYPVATRVPETNIVDRICGAVNTAAIWYPKRVLCLQRSAVTTCMLRRSGIAATMAMGAQVLPIKAHAWTEVDGKAINERRDVQRIYTIWERC